MEKYYADKKILGVTVLEDVKTPSGADIVKIIFEDGSEQITSKARYDLIVTDEISDLSTAQQKLNARVGSLLFSTLHEYDIKLGEVNAVSDSMVQLVEAGHSKAASYLWGASYLDIPLLSVNKILLQHATEKSNDGATSAGGGTDTENKE